MQGTRKFRSFINVLKIEYQLNLHKLLIYNIIHAMFIINVNKSG